MVSLSDGAVRLGIVVSEFNYDITRMMLDGKKSISTRIMYEALDVLTSKSDKTAVEAFETALENVKPMVEVKSRRVGGSTYQVPVEIRESRREALAMRWLIQSSRSRSGKLVLPVTSCSNATPD